VCSGVSLSTRHDATLSCRDHPPSLQLCSANRTHQLYSSHLCTPLDARRLCVPRGCDKGLELLAAVRPERFFNRHLPSRTRDFLPHATTRKRSLCRRTVSVRSSVCLSCCLSHSCIVSKQVRIFFKILSPSQPHYSTLCLKKNAPIFARCGFDKHGLILIIFGQQHQHTFKNDRHI